jgi:hypothetical protein
MNRMQIRTVDTLAQPDVAVVNKAVNDRAVERQRSRGGGVSAHEIGEGGRTLVTEAEIQTFFATDPEFTAATDLEIKKDRLAEWLEQERVAKGFAIPSIDRRHGAGTPAATRAYQDWDRRRVNEIFGR